MYQNFHFTRGRKLPREEMQESALDHTIGKSNTDIQPQILSQVHFIYYYNTLLSSILMPQQVHKHEWKSGERKEKIKKYIFIFFSISHSPFGTWVPGRNTNIGWKPKNVAKIEQASEWLCLSTRDPGASLGQMLFKHTPISYMESILKTNTYFQSFSQTNLREFVSTLCLLGSISKLTQRGLVV